MRIKTKLSAVGKTYAEVCIGRNIRIEISGWLGKNQSKLVVTYKGKTILSRQINAELYPLWTRRAFGLSQDGLEYYLVVAQEHDGIYLDVHPKT